MLTTKKIEKQISNQNQAVSFFINAKCKNNLLEILFVSYPFYGVVLSSS